MNNKELNKYFKEIIDYMLLKQTSEDNNIEFLDFSKYNDIEGCQRLIEAFKDVNEELKNTKSQIYSFRKSKRLPTNDKLFETITITYIPNIDKASIDMDISMKVENISKCIYIDALVTLTGNDGIIINKINKETQVISKEKLNLKEEEITLGDLNLNIELLEDINNFFKDIMDEVYNKKNKIL